MYRKKLMEYRECIEGCIDKLLFLGVLIINRDLFVFIVIINLLCCMIKIIYFVKISLIYGIFLYVNVIICVFRYKYRMCFYWVGDRIVIGFIF